MVDVVIVGGGAAGLCCAGYAAGRGLSVLVAEGREPFCLLGANIGTRQRYIRIYTERLIAYLNGSSLED